MTRHCGRQRRLKVRRRRLHCGRQSRPRRPRAPVAGRTRRLGAVPDGQEPRLGASTRHKTDLISPKSDRPEPKHTHLRHEGRISSPSDDLDDDFRRGTDLRVAAPEVNHGPRSPFLPAGITDRPNGSGYLSNSSIGNHPPYDRARLCDARHKRRKRAAEAARMRLSVTKRPTAKRGQPKRARPQARRQPPVKTTGEPQPAPDRL